MICKYCGCNTDSKDGICKACSYKLSIDPIQGGDIYSSSGAEKTNEANRKTVAPKVPPISQNIYDYKPVTPLNNDLPLYAPPRTSVTDNGGKAKGTKVKGAKSKGFFISAIIIALVLVVSGLYLTGILKTNTGKVKGHLRDGNYTAAYSVFEKNFTTEGSKSLNKMLKNRLNEVYTEYANGEREYQAAKEEIDTIEKMGVTPIKDTLKKVKKDFAAMKESKDNFKNGENYFSKKKYDLSIKAYSKVIKADCNYQIATEKKEQAIGNYRNTVFTESDKLMADGDMPAAIKILEEALEVLGKDSRISERLKKYKEFSTNSSRTTLLDEADEYAFSNNYAGAINILAKAIENNKDYASDEIIMDTLEEYRKEYTKQFGEKMDEYIKNSQYDKAAELIKEAERVIPGSKTVQDKAAELENKIPVYLDELEATDTADWKFNKGKSTDTFGSDHSGNGNYIRLTSESTAVYLLTESFENFKCNIVAAKEIDPSVKCKVKITATVGGEYVYREVEVSAADEEQEITIATEDCTALTISVSGEGAKVLMYDARLTRE